jgi:hypothetical protein
VRGRKGLCKYIVRQQVKGTLTRKPAPETEPDFYRLGMVRCANTENVQAMERQGDTTPTLSDLMMTARVAQSNTRTYSMPSSSMFSNNVVARPPGFSNAHGNSSAMGRQQYTKMSFGDLQGPSAQSLMAAMGAAPKFQQFCNGSSVPTFNHTASSETHNSEPDCYNTGNESVVTMLRPPRYAICEGTQRMIQLSNPEPEGYRCNQSVVSMLCPSRYSKYDEAKRILHMNNSVEPQFMTNEQPSKAFNVDFDNTGFESFSTSFFPGPAMEAPVIDEPFGTTDNNTIFNESNHFDWMPQKAYHH